MAFKNDPMSHFQDVFDVILHLDYRRNKRILVWTVLVVYLFTYRPRHCHWEWPNVAASQVLPFPLVTEEFQFSLLLLVQAVAVAYLDTHT